MHRRCCWPPESAPPGASSRSFTSFHRPARVRQRSTSSSASCRHVDAGELQAGQHVLADGHGRERVGLLEHHADPAPHVGGPGAGAVDVVAVEAGPRRPARPPGTSSCIRLRMRRNVDLPQPDGPMSAVTLPPACRCRRSSTCVLAEPGASTPSATQRPAAEVTMSAVVSTVVSMRTSAIGMSVIRTLSSAGRPLPGPSVNRASTSRISTRAPAQPRAIWRRMALRTRWKANSGRDDWAP